MFITLFIKLFDSKTKRPYNTLFILDASYDFGTPYTAPGGGGGHSLIWPIRGRAAGQGMVFGLVCPEQGIQFYANLS